LAIAALVSSAAACASSATGPEEEEIVGRWRWVRAVGGIDARTRTPMSEGYLLQAHFDARGRATLYRDGDVLRATRYEVTLGLEAGSFPGEPVIHVEESLFGIGGFDEIAVVFPHPDTLQLAEECCDRYTYTFVRVRGFR
jgi:hypothetical protein